MHRLIRRLTILSLFFVFIVILAGSIVRATGSGMGCPDWPKCFGYFIPPTSTDQVTWKEARAFDAGQMVIHQEQLFEAKSDFVTGAQFNPENWERYNKHDYAVFNPFHTWVEYVNRLTGGASGIPITLLFFTCTWYLIRHRKPGYFLIAGFSMVVLGAIAWLGKLVVDGNLIPAQVTLHMVGSILLVGLLLLILRKTTKLRYAAATPLVHALLVSALVLTLAQVFIGTQVREAVDIVKASGMERSGWIAELPNSFKFHRSFSILVLLVNIALTWFVVKKGLGWRLQFGVLGVLGLEVLAGVVLSYADMPAAMQPVHLVLAIVLASVQLYQIYLVFTSSWVKRRSSLIA